MAASAPPIIFGTAAVSSFSPEELTGIFDVLKKHNVKSLDSASLYQGSEAKLGEVGAPKDFVIHTKAPGNPEGSKKQVILNGLEKSLKELGVDSVDLYYFHAPDPKTPIEESLSAIQEGYAAGKFKRFGLSNFLPEDVQKVYDVQLAAKLNISFYAYSPIAGGFLVKEASQLRSKSIEDGRFSGENPASQLYHALYNKEVLLQALDEWGIIAKDAGITKAALAYRWIAYHSAVKEEHGDAIIIGARTVSQLEETLTGIEDGPLESSVAKKASDIWEKVKAEAPRDNYNSFFANM